MSDETIYQQMAENNLPMDSHEAPNMPVEGRDAAPPSEALRSVLPLHESGAPVVDHADRREAMPDITGARAALADIDGQGGTGTALLADDKAQRLAASAGKLYSEVRDLLLWFHETHDADHMARLHSTSLDALRTIVADVQGVLDVDRLREYVNSHEHGDMSDDGLELARELWKQGDDYATIAHEIVFRDLTKPQWKGGQPVCVECGGPRDPNGDDRMCADCLEEAALALRDTVGAIKQWYALAERQRLSKAIAAAGGRDARRRDARIRMCEETARALRLELETGTAHCACCLDRQRKG